MARRSEAWCRIGIRIACGVVVLMNTTGCMTWRAVPAATSAPGDESLSRARIVMRDGTTVVWSDVTVRSDSVVGHVGADHTRVAVAAPQVARVEIRKVGVGETLGLIGGVLGVAAIVFLIALAHALSEYTAAPSPLPSTP